MGFGIMEIHQNLEDTFDITLPPEDFVGVKTVDDLCQYVVKKWEEENQNLLYSRSVLSTIVCPHLAAYAKVREICQQFYGCNPRSVRSEATIDSLIPESNRQVEWQRMVDSLSEFFPRINQVKLEFSLPGYNEKTNFFIEKRKDYSNGFVALGCLSVALFSMNLFLIVITGNLFFIFLLMTPKIHEQTYITRFTTVKDFVIFLTQEIPARFYRDYEVACKVIEILSDYTGIVPGKIEKHHHINYDLGVW